MKRCILLFPAVLYCFLCFGQIKIKTKKYPSLLWEITGNGIKKPSYLFGTMHVSSKIAFHLSDSFYVALRNAEVVALETNPESWQEDMDRYEVNDYGYSRNDTDWENVFELPNDFLTERSLRINRYEKLLERALFSQPSIINNLLYRSHSDKSSDFEEDTYLDMYIYQAGKKLGKRVAGVEDYGESMRLMAEAYRDAAKDKNTRDRSYDYEDMAPDKLQEAYRMGNLDLLDSLNRLNSTSDAFDEKFLYRRNVIQARSIDSILRRSSLFVGVGAAHLPGPRGVIELLRKKGYRLRPIMMGSRDSRHKDQVEKLRVPVTFSTQTADDGFFNVDIPGKFYRFNEYSILDQQQYADMANGSYYMVTRIKTNSLFWGHGPEVVARKIDSVLYENVPGKILSKTAITRNGYRGIDIINRTRRGDFQRYNIFITPYEVLFFKMGSNGEYVKKGEEAKKFFGSIRLKEFKNGGWKKFEPAYGGFSVELPQEPFEIMDGNAEYDAEDKSTGTHFKVFRTDIHNYNFAEEDTFDLNLMDESYASSDFINKRLIHKQSVFKGYPSLECSYLHKDGSVSFTRFIIQGPHYYMLLAHAKKENPGLDLFLNSFELKPFVYGKMEEQKDTSLYYTVRTTWYPAPGKEKIEVPDQYSYDDEGSGDDESGWWDSDDYNSTVITNDTTGEKIVVTSYCSPKYFYSKDSTEVEEKTGQYSNDTTWIIRSRKKTELPGKMKVWDVEASGINSSRTIRSKTFYRNGIGFVLMTEGDTLTAPSSFVKSFFDNFTPADTLKGINPYEKKSKIFFDDLFSRDSAARSKAIRFVSQVEFDSSDLFMLDKAIHSFKWSDKNYLDRKVNFINKLGGISNKESADLLKEIYIAAGDTVKIQNSALETLLKQRTQYAFNLFRDIITAEPPVLDNTINSYSLYPPVSAFNKVNDYLAGISNGNFLDELYDSLLLTRTILPDLLPLMNLDDYKWPMMRLLRTLVDSNLVRQKDYEMYFSKFLIEAKQELRKQAIDEKKKSIEKAEEDKLDKKAYSLFEDSKDTGNEKLVVYATLLLPFNDNHPSVAPLIQQLLQSRDKRLKYNTMLLLLRNNRTVPDTLTKYFAAMNEYRYELYSDMKKIKKEQQFPAAWNNHLDLAKSRLLSSKTYGAPDSLVYIDKLQTEFRGRIGYVYFFKYKQKKDDAVWKLASAGLVPLDPATFEFSDDKSGIGYTSVVPGWNSTFNSYGKYNFNGFSDEKIKEDEPIIDQLNRQLKKMIYSKRKSGKMFYNDKEDAYSASTDDAGDD